MIFICGEICSGKTYYGKILAKGLDKEFVDVSTIVKKILQTNLRISLQGNPQLDVSIIESLKQLPGDCVVSGVRQQSILESFPDSTFIWLDVSQDIRFKRCMERQDKKDILSWEAFQQAEQKDAELGLQQVKQYILNRSK